MLVEDIELVRVTPLRATATVMEMVVFVNNAELGTGASMDGCVESKDPKRL
jgi:hypothetical protein